MWKLVVAGALALAAGSGAAQVRGGSVVSITDRDDGNPIRVSVGEEIRATLTQEPRSGYRWELRRDARLALIETPKTQEVYGSGGRRQQRLFRIRVVDPGRFMLIFGLRRIDGSADEPPQRRIVFTVDARPARDLPPGEPEWDEGGPDTIEPLVEADANDVIDVPVGQVRTIALPSNASTGFRWSAGFERNLSIVDIAEQRPRGARIGQGGTTLIEFRVLRRGPVEVTLGYIPAGGGRARRSLVYRFRGI